MVLTGYIIASLYALVCLFIAGLVYKLGLPKKYTRKIVHILVGFEWVILYRFMGAGLHFLIVCLAFLAILAISYKAKLMPMISSDADNAPGTVYYSVAMSGVAIVGCFLPEIMLPFGIGVMCTSVGDGFAGVVGQLFKKNNPRIYENKSLIGTSANFILSSGCAFVLSIVYGMDLSLIQCMAIGLLSAELELVTGFGLDNISVTWGTTALAYGFMYFANVNNYLFPILLTAPIIIFSKSKKALTKDGLFAAIALDILVSIAFGNFGFVTLCVFFVGSIIIDKIKKRSKKASRNMVEKKGDCRDWVQVLANGLVCAIASVAFLITKKSIFLVPFVASLAEALADTVASGMGAFANRTYDLFRLKKCEKGISGGMSFVGTVSSLIASFTISLSALCWRIDGFGAREFLIVSLSGFAGALLDSFLGSVLQAKYKCTICGQITEREDHCDTPTVLTAGCASVDNDIVNVISCAFAAVLATALALLV